LLRSRLAATLLALTLLASGTAGTLFAPTERAEVSGSGPTGSHRGILPSVRAPHRGVTFKKLVGLFGPARPPLAHSDSHAFKLTQPVDRLTREPRAASHGARSPPAV
jgi:hypothetical protein